MSKYIWWLMVVLVGIKIFAFSAEDAKTSTDTSLNVSQKIVETLPSTKNLPEPEKKEVAKEIEGEVRKVAHFVIYTALGFFMTGATKRTFSKYAVIIAFIACTIFALSDEIHQLFVDGRTFEVTDMLLDCVGSLAGIGIYFILAKIILLLKLRKG